MSGKEALRIRVNGEPAELQIAPHRTLLEVLREDLGLTGAKRGCDDGSCGACTVLVDGEPRLACLSLALLVDGAAVTTIEGIASDGRLSALQEAFLTTGGLQCGYCTPGMVLAAEAHLRSSLELTDEAIREGLAGNLCRCTGYAPIAEAVRRAALERQEAGGRTA
jgi:aerobic-type carbon monoxide dehydrogenase small subunit (CoxS/CutS family)